MSSFLAYSYSTTSLPEEEQIKIDQRTQKSREEFAKGFLKGASFSFAAYSLYSLRTSAAYAADSNVPAPQTPGNTCAVQPAPTPKPGFKPLSEAHKGSFVGAASAICGAASQSGDFYLGLAFAFLCVVGGIIIHRPRN